MITEDYVSGEIAKLLNTKGFKGEFHKHYWGYVTGKEFLTEGSFNSEYDYPAPTLQMVMKWLREVHNLVVNPVGHYVDGKLESWEVDIYFLDCGIDATINAMGHIYGKTYESACENGIEYCLEKLI